MDNKHSTNVTGISSAWRSRASTVKVDAPLVMERVPASVGLGVVSPAMRSLTKTVEKHYPPPANCSHQSATSPDCKLGGWSWATTACENGREGPRASSRASSRALPSLECFRQDLLQRHVWTFQHCWAVARVHKVATLHADHTTGWPAYKSPLNKRRSLWSPWEPPFHADPCHGVLQY